MLARALVLLSLLPSPVAAQTLRITYLANEGVLLETAAGRILIDALFADGLAQYQKVEQPVRDSLERARGAFGGRALVLATHMHRDHLDAAAAVRYLGSNADATAILPADAATRARELAADPATRARIHDAAVPERGVREHDLGWVHARALGMPHGRTSVPVDHAAWLVRLDGWTALHIGDTSMPPDEWAAFDLPADGIDVAFVSYWYMTNAELAQAWIAAARPRTIVVLHGPVPAGESPAMREAGGWDAVRADLRARYANVHTPWTAGEVITLRK